MNELKRRTFLQATSAAAWLGANATALTTKADQGKPIGVAYVGCGGRSKNLLDNFKQYTTAVRVCDPDAKRAADFQKRSSAARTTGDLR